MGKSSTPGERVTRLTEEELVAEVKGFLATRNYSTPAKETEALCWWNSNKSNYPNLANFARRYHLEAPSSVNSKRLFSKVLATCMSTSAIACFQKPAKSFYFSITTCIPEVFF